MGANYDFDNYSGEVVYLSSVPDAGLGLPTVRACQAPTQLNASTGSLLRSRTCWPTLKPISNVRTREHGHLRVTDKAWSKLHMKLLGYWDTMSVPKGDPNVPSTVSCVAKVSVNSMVKTAKSCLLKQMTTHQSAGLQLCARSKLW